MSTLGGWGGWGGWGTSGPAGADIVPMLAQALTLNRAALTGPFQGATFPVDLPSPLDQAERLPRWEMMRAMQACEIELLSGLVFTPTGNEMKLRFVDLHSAAPYTSGTVATLVRPTDTVFKAQVELVSNYSELRESRASEIVAQSMPTQLPFWTSIIGLQPYRQPWTQALAGMALSMTVDVEMRFKHAFACPRPETLSPQIQPMIPTPGHASWPSGHSTESFMVAELLESLLDAAGRNGAGYTQQLQRLAARVAVNRTVAGLHYPVDSAAGRLLGTALARFFVARCRGGDVHEWTFDGPEFHGENDAAIDFDPRVLVGDVGSRYYKRAASPWTVGKSPLLAFVWEAARAEWQTAAPEPQ